MKFNGKVSDDSLSELEFGFLIFLIIFLCFLIVGFWVYWFKCRKKWFKCMKLLKDSLLIHCVSSRDPESLSSSSPPSSIASPSSVIKMKSHTRFNVRKYSKDKIIKNEIQQSLYIDSNTTRPRSGQANIPMPNIQPDVSELSELVINTNDAFEYKEQANVKLSDMIKKYQMAKSMGKLPLQQIKSEITNQINQFIYSKTS